MHLESADGTTDILEFKSPEKSLVSNMSRSYRSGGDTVSGSMSTVSVGSGSGVAPSYNSSSGRDGGGSHPYATTNNNKYPKGKVNKLVN